MCGIFYIQTGGKSLKGQREFIARALVEIEKRGGHSWGYVTLDDAGHVMTESKSLGRSHLVPGMLDGVALLVHTRFATTAPVRTHFSQPVRTPRGWGVHNGHVYGEILAVPDVVSDLDSAHLLYALGENDAEALATLSGYAATLFLDDTSPHLPRAWADGGQLHVGTGHSLLVACSVPVKQKGVKWERSPGDGTTQVGWIADGGESHWYSSADRHELGGEAWGSAGSLWETYGIRS